MNEERNQDEPWWGEGGEWKYGPKTKRHPKPKPETHDCHICGWHIDPREKQNEHKGLLGEPTVYLCDLCEERESRNLVPAYDQHKHGRRGPFWPWDDPKDLVRDA